MQQVQTISITDDASWLQRRCRDLVLAELGKMTDACIHIEEGDSSTVLGDPNRELQATMRIHDAQTYVDLTRGGSIGAAEAFINQYWSTPNLTNLIRVFARCQQQLDNLEQQRSWFNKVKNWLIHKTNLNTKGGSKKNIVAHYDLGNELYKRFLDPEMMYSSAIYADGEDSLHIAQLNKLELTCQRLQLKPEDHLIEIGTGWGGMAIYAAQNYGCRVTTTTISEQQYAYAKARVEALGLSEKITLLKKDYRELTGKYDKLVSIEMIEAVGKEYMAGFFKHCSNLLKPHGRLVIQAITIADQRYHYYANSVDFIQRYIFPGGCLPSVTVMSEHICNQTDMMIDGLHDIGLDYAKTLQDWRHSFNQKWTELNEIGYGEDFKRLWNFYLCYCEGAFLERRTSTVQLTASKPMANVF